MRTIGVDTGGTFTDLVAIDAEGRVRFAKAFSTPANPEQAVFDVMDELARSEEGGRGEILADTARFVHGTTVSTNALIQRRGARVGLLVTKGFEDTLAIGRGPMGRTGGLPVSQALDFLHAPIPEPLVPRDRIVGLAERVAVTGEVLAALRPEEVREALETLLEKGIESLAVCLLWSFRNPAHELLVREVVGELAPGLPLSLSSEVAPRMGEFERTVTTAANAFIGPVSERYIGTMQERLAGEGLASPLQVMKSTGGVTLARRVGTEAVSIINSGPIGGLIAARHIGQFLGHSNIITADMGGTSFDVGIIAGGAFEEQKTPFIDQGLPVHVPAIKVVTIGAGGGSIAWTDGHRLHVGPQSAGARPGPVAYGNGGTEPTVTDALVALGIIDAGSFFGGRRSLDRAAAERAIQKRIAEPLGLSMLEAASGIFEVVTAKMSDLIRKATIESGNNPKDFCLLSYGGAGGAHCAAFSAQLGIKKVVIPYAAPVFSALGCAFSDVLASHSRSEPVAIPGEDGALAGLDVLFAELRDKVVSDMAAAGFRAQDLTLVYKLDLRFEGQMNEVTLAWDREGIRPEDVPGLRAAFDAHYEQRFGRGTTHAQSGLELISIRAEALRPMPKPVLAPLFRAEKGAENTPRTRRRIHQHRLGWVDAAIYDFESLVPGAVCSGPAVIERENTTVWLPGGSRSVLDVYGNLEIQPVEAA